MRTFGIQYVIRRATRWGRACVFQESGATAVEYAVLLALILLVCISAVSTFGGGSGNLWVNNASQLSSAGLGGSTGS